MARPVLPRPSKERLLQFGMELRAARLRNKYNDASVLAAAMEPHWPDGMGVTGSQIRRYEAGEAQPRHPAQVAALER
jgi:hypothetical protein